MSWSVSASGTSDAVAKKLATDFAAIKVVGPEIEVVKAAAAMMAAGLAAQVPAAVVKASAGGSQYTSSQSGAPDRFTNSVTISIEPLWGFLE